MKGHVSEKPLSFVDKKLQARKRKDLPEADEDTGFKSKPKKRVKLTRKDILRV